MSIFRSVHNKAELVPVFVMRSKRSERMELYGFHEGFSPIFDDQFEPSSHVGLAALPFTGVNSCPIGCTFMPEGDSIWVVGGTVLSHHLINQLHNLMFVKKDLLSMEDIATTITDKDKLNSLFYPSPAPLPHHEEVDLCEVQVLSLRQTISASIHNRSNRVRAFCLQKFVDDKQTPQLQFHDIDHYSKYWNSATPSHTARSGCILFRLPSNSGMLLYAVRGGEDDPSLPTLFLDVWVHGEWVPVIIDQPDSCAFSGDITCSVAVEGALLLGSDRSSVFSAIVPDYDNYFRAKVASLDIECPAEFVSKYLGSGIVLDKGRSWDDTIVVWNNPQEHCILGIHLGHKQHFFINFVNEKLVNLDFDAFGDARNLESAKLIGFGDGTLGMIYHKLGNAYGLTEYRCVRFEIIYHYSSRVPYPGIGVKTRIISDRKCYGPSWTEMHLHDAFVMEVCFPHKVENLSSIKE